MLSLWDASWSSQAPRWLSERIDQGRQEQEGRRRQYWRVCVLVSHCMSGSSACRFSRVSAFHSWRAVLECHYRFESASPEECPVRITIQHQKNTDDDRCCRWLTCDKPLCWAFQNARNSVHLRKTFELSVRFSFARCTLANKVFFEILYSHQRSPCILRDAFGRESCQSFKTQY